MSEKLCLLKKKPNQLIEMQRRQAKSAMRLLKNIVANTYTIRINTKGIMSGMISATIMLSRPVIRLNWLEKRDKPGVSLA
jgi:hypothetical protein